ncbi:MAG: hypothetical protein ACYC33_02385 [Thermoleophilia bacterium]
MGTVVVVLAGAVVLVVPPAVVDVVLPPVVVVEPLVVVVVAPVVVVVAPVVVVVAAGWQVAQPETECVVFEEITAAVPWHAVHLLSSGVSPITAWQAVHALAACVVSRWMPVPAPVG